MLQEHVFERTDIGIIRVVGEVEEGEEMKVKHIDFAEYETTKGRVYVLSPAQTVAIMRLASTENEAIHIARNKDLAGPDA